LTATLSGWWTPVRKALHRPWLKWSFCRESIGGRGGGGKTPREGVAVVRKEALFKDCSSAWREVIASDVALKLEGMKTSASHWPGWKTASQATEGRFFQYGVVESVIQTLKNQMEM